ncbi:type II toxin-antitoxin system HicB family antitoxin [Granulicella paludicola]|uniref:type II toxin-antitoxin system HicB family antitoxin n=1 Tax=Granulicella paludicola TaxID=474951 RepID=UPI0021DFF888|nr:type II toxin-antitoxin system HicB family antitoxin [Granulicella paludicola]
MREYAVVFGQTSTGWSAYVPDLPGLAAAGSTYEETEQLMREAMELHLTSMKEDGDPIPEPTTRIGVVGFEISERQFAKSA